MLAAVRFQETAKDTLSLILIVNGPKEVEGFISKGPMRDYAVSKLQKPGDSATINLFEKHLLIYRLPEFSPDKQAEETRRKGNDFYNYCKTEKITKIQLASLSVYQDDLLNLFEGFYLSQYSFQKYKTEKKENTVEEIIITGKVEKVAFSEYENLCKANFLARTLVNEPLIYLTAEQFSEEITKAGKEAGFKVEVFNKAKIKSLKMGGLLAVNEGSPNPPTFNILEYKPAGAVNKNPVILVGKGVVYDTGGLSLKPTPNSMDYMKCDMAGGAVVVGTLHALAKNNIPVYAVGLIPATENRPDGNAITPGDVITMYSGKTVEILNTDAEGRLILGDALCYAAKYKPELVFDIATLTGAAARAIGKEGIVYMGNADKVIKNQFEETGYQVHERLVEFPLWDEYNKMIESDIADIKNIGGEDAGAITAGKFLEAFVNYPWLHLDIAGPAYVKVPDSYRGKNASAIGVRLLYHFIKNKYTNNGK
jgi:leucyl aminopeptidase